MITRTVTHSEGGKRLHRYLRNLLPNIPLGQIYKMIDQGKVRVNGKRKNQNYEMAAGDELHIYMEEESYQQASGGGDKAVKKPKFAGISTQIDVVYEDTELLVANKPVGLLTHPDQAEQRDTLINRVHAYLYKKGELDSAYFLPATANRLDRNTSGLVLIGKTAGMLHQLNQWIQRREMEKYYVTIVEGKLARESTIAKPLTRIEKENRTAIATTAEEKETEKEAVTKFRPLHTANGYTLVEVELISGRTHQIRTHFQSIGHPLLGDIKYGGREVADVNHQLLHAWKIVMPDGRKFESLPPGQFGRMLRQLGLTLPTHQ
ncbi:RluA family pseudouridine synthase [Paenibacillus koleovorans]|uniref:RluA family pseudouridine synthase n=1 Tax=Paenibacillus koleovorans TaxID=121608 RepID=UPI0013E34917|nr:RluA family pseudouridine synthase [Paenibacillus koleovorans]